MSTVRLPEFVLHWAKELEEFSFAMPAPNPWTPRLVGLAATMRYAAYGASGNPPPVENTPEPAMKCPDCGSLGPPHREGCSATTPPPPAPDGGIVYPAGLQAPSDRNGWNASNVLMRDEIWSTALRTAELARQEAERLYAALAGDVNAKYWNNVRDDNTKLRERLQAAERERDRLKDRLDSIEAYGVENATDVLDLIKSRDAAIAERDKYLECINEAEDAAEDAGRPEGERLSTSINAIYGQIVDWKQSSDDWKYRAQRAEAIAAHHPKPEARGEEPKPWQQVNAEAVLAECRAQTKLMQSIADTLERKAAK